MSQPKPATRKPSTPPKHHGLVETVVEDVEAGLEGILDAGREGSLDDRDPEFIAQHLRWVGPLVDRYFRGEVRHLDRIPASGPVLCVGNHSGGLLSPDTVVLMAAFYRHFGVERLSYGLAHNLVVGLPVAGSVLRRAGALPADHVFASAALKRGAAVLVYPGGDEDVFRSWRERNRIHLAGRTGFVRLALHHRVPIVPVVSIGGHETLLVMSNGRWIARHLGLEKLRIKSLPLVLGPPWGISPGDLLGHWPLPAKITVDCGRPIDLHQKYGDHDPRDPEVLRDAYRFVERRMQTMLNALAKERKLPIVG
jgi:1-acyl-sn-glycerol-3-phosphate acyltransferase